MKTLERLRLCIFLWLLTLTISCAQKQTQELKSYPVSQTSEHTVKAGETLSQVLELWKIPQQNEFINSWKKNGQTHVRVGTSFKMHRSLGPLDQLQAIEQVLNSRVSILYKPEKTTWTSQESIKLFEERSVSFSGLVSTSLWESAQNANMDTELLLRLADIFAWVIDFSREIQKGDEWRLVATEYVHKGVHKGWKEIRIAEIKRGKELYQAFFYEDPDSNRKGFFNASGESLEKIFLKSPLKFGRISSRFTRKRFHPVLRTNRPHLGVDYAASTGTPVMAIGDGTVDFAAYSGGGGKIIKLRHNSTYTTAYKHLSRFASGLRVGKKVRQGEIIGYVGSTGLSTGPHLHFEFLKNSVFVDPMGLKFPSATPLKSEEKERFELNAKLAVALLPKWASQNGQVAAVRVLASPQAPTN